jgi:medium-chain acyl-[acyl-carrier-protein] hydrolase
MTARWLHRPCPVSEPAARLVCFPYAGRSGTVYRAWAPLLPPGVELCGVNLPGRESRFDEPLPSGLDDLVADLAAALRPVLDIPVAFFGHSLGALLAFEVSRELRRDGVAQPRHLIVSGCRPLHLADQGPSLAGLHKDLLIGELRKLNGTAEEILTNKAAIELLLPVLRADFHLAETYRYRAEEPLSCPITALAGSADPETAAVDLNRWQELTTAEFVLRRFAGDHFFLDSARPMVVAAAAQTVLPYLLQPAGQAM